ncbi:MAG: VCBS repeat-containing protein [Firmicutes bacterium]|nr:VCBS repeat-containing protein [Bacillota bacterium]
MRFCVKATIAILLIFATMPLVWAVPPPPFQYAAKDFLYEAWFKIEAADLLGTGASQLVVLGRDYLAGRLSLQLLSWDGEKPVSKWESPNLLAEGPVMMSFGRPFPGGVPALIVLTQAHLYVYNCQNEQIILSSQFPHGFSPLELAVADLDGDGQDELLVARLGERRPAYDEHVVEVYRLTEAGMDKVGGSGLLGQIRSMTAGDLDGDGCAEVVTDTGLSSRAGVCTVLAWDPERQELVTRLRVENLLATMAFGLTVAAGDNRPLLYTADGWGRLNRFQLADGRLLPVSEHYSFPNGLIGVAVGDLDGDGEEEIAVVGHPNNLYVVSLN